MLSFVRSLVSFSAMKMNKSGTQTGNGTTTLLAGWVVDPGFPDTDITTTANTITVKTAGTGKALTAAIAYTSGTSGYGLVADVYKNGAVLAGVTTNVSTTTTASGTVNISLSGMTVAVGDKFDIRISNRGLGSPVVQAAGTFLQIS